MVAAVVRDRIADRIAELAPEAEAMTLAECADRIADRVAEVTAVGVSELARYQAACRALERARDTWHDLLVAGDRRTAKAALAVVEYYRGAQDEAFGDWRRTWDGVEDA
jgi:hypothetical protein